MLTVTAAPLICPMHTTLTNAEVQVLTFEFESALAVAGSLSSATASTAAATRAVIDSRTTLFAPAGPKPT